MSGLLAHLLPRLGLVAALFAGTVAITGCAATDGMVEKLYDSTRAYNKSLRWGDWDRAAAYVPQESSDAFMESHMAVDDRLVVIDYEMTRMEVDKVNGVAASQVEISWHTETELVVRHTTVNHLWQWYEGSWILVDERRAGGRPLAIFTDVPEDEPHPYLPGLEAFRETYAIGLDPDEKRKRDREKQKAEKKKASQAGPKYSLDDMQSMPTEQRPASFN